mmetsp:Transcript_7529/g.22001  ORF Transcript_7529/g.22001 Transcript_7529/m.22001 type:complete len:216 (+) Transcript_7529:540-1187(+)
MPSPFGDAPMQEMCPSWALLIVYVGAMLRDSESNAKMDPLACPQKINRPLREKHMEVMPSPGMPSPMDSGGGRSSPNLFNSWYDRRSKMRTVPSSPHDANVVLSDGMKSTQLTSSVCPVNVICDLDGARMSHSLMVRSTLHERKVFLSFGRILRNMASPMCSANRSIILPEATSHRKIVESPELVRMWSWLTNRQHDMKPSCEAISTGRSGSDSL